MLLVHGMTGIGKTALAERLAAESLGALPYPYIQVVLDRGVGSPEFTRGAIAILDAMDDLTAQQLPDDRILPYLLKQLRESPIWLQLDSVEYLLQPNAQGRSEFVDSVWVEFFEQVLCDRHCQSRLMLTSQSIPEDLAARLERIPQLWQAHQLDGLATAEYLTLFHNCGITPRTEAETNYLYTIATYFQGHPYILKMIAADLKGKLMGGNVNKYWQDYWLPRQQQNTAPLSQEQRACKWVDYPC